MRLSHAIKTVVAVSVAVSSVFAFASSASAAPTATHLTGGLSKSTSTYGNIFHASGHVLDSSNNQVTSGTVYLQRRLFGTTTYRTVGTDTTAGSFDFRTKAVGNAIYRVSYAGNATYAPKAGSATLHVRRDLNDRNPYGTRISGNVNPGWSRMLVTVQRKKCAGCAYSTYKRIRTTSSGGFGITVPAPRSGSWYYRVVVPKTTTFIASISGAYRAYRL